MSKLSELAEWHKHQLNFLPETENVLVKFHKEAAALLLEMDQQKPVAWRKTMLSEGFFGDEGTPLYALPVVSEPAQTQDDVQRDAERWRIAIENCEIYGPRGVISTVQEFDETFAARQG